MKKFNQGLLLVLSIALVSSCSNEQKDSKLFFSNNIENGYVWGDHSPSIQRFDNAHSGNYVCKLDEKTPYSVVFNMREKAISTKQLKKATVTAWFLLTGTNSEQNLVIDVRDSADQNSLQWSNMNAANSILDVNKWGQAELSLDLTQKGWDNPNNCIRIYAANGKGEPVYVDDIEIRFEE